MIEAIGLKIIASGFLEYHYFLTNFNENLPSGSKVISRGQTDSQPFWNDRGYV
jgi:hypothetical protein